MQMKRSGRLTDRGLELVASRNPDLDASFLEVSDGLGYAVLEPILNSGGAQEVKLALDAFAGSVDLLLAVLKRDCRLMVRFGPRFVFFLCGNSQ